MKRPLTLLVMLAWAACSHAATTISPENRFAYGANLGWVDWGGDAGRGAVLGEYVCSGYLYAANVGWINLGNGSPTNGIHYQQLSAQDFGVNHDGRGNLRGYAWGANVGWLCFEEMGAPKVDLTTGRLSGYLYSANLGWISLSNAAASVQTVTLAPGEDADGNGLPDAWELQHFARRGVSPNNDPDHDGVANFQEYRAATNPLDDRDTLRISHCVVDPAASRVTLTWLSQPTRQYRIWKASAFNSPGSWTEVELGLVNPGEGSTTSWSFGDTGWTNTFYRIEALKPLSPTP